jgi:uncharacterized membrane protein YqaE (UPF0057 family)
MRYPLALIVPPLAVLSCGRPITALFNVLLWALLIVPGVIHARLVVSQHQADVRSKKQARTIARANQKQRA